MDKQIFGRKVFFLYPNTLIRNDLIIPLIDKEFDVYILDSHKMISAVDHMFKNSVLFINIDDKLTITEWDRIISNYSNPERSQNISIGILSYNENKNITLKYANIFRVSSGFFSLRQRSEDLLNKIITTLNNHNVKENRKFLRAQFTEPLYRFEVSYKGQLRSGYINDLSCVGMTIIFQKPFMIEKNSLINDISLYVKESVINVSGIFLGVQRDINDKVIYVLIFNKSVKDSTKSRIRLMINRYNQNLLKECLSVPYFIQ